MKTNADMIRSMNDEELEAWLEKALNDGYEGFEYWVCNRCKAENDGRCPTAANDTCGRGGRPVLEWLKAEAKN